MSAARSCTPSFAPICLRSSFLPLNEKLEVRPVSRSAGIRVIMVTGDHPQTAATGPFGDDGREVTAAREETDAPLRSESGRTRSGEQVGEAQLGRDVDGLRRAGAVEVVQQPQAQCGVGLDVVDDGGVVLIVL